MSAGPGIVVGYVLEGQVLDEAWYCTQRTENVDEAQAWAAWLEDFCRIEGWTRMRLSREVRNTDGELVAKSILRETQ